MRIRVALFSATLLGLGVAPTESAANDQRQPSGADWVAKFPGSTQVEDLEVEPPDLTTGAAARFLEACGVQAEGIEHVLASATTIVGEHGSAILRVAFGDTLRVQVVPPSAPAIEPRPVTAPA